MDFFVSCKQCGNLAQVSSKQKLNFCPQCGHSFSASVSHLSEGQIPGFENIQQQLQKIQYSQLSPIKKIFARSVYLGILFVSFFTALLISTAGIAVIPELGDVSGPLVCHNGYLTYKKERYSYKPGQSGTSVDFFCVDQNGNKKNIGLEVTFYSWIVYGVLLFISLSPIYFVVKKIIPTQFLKK